MSLAHDPALCVWVLNWTVTYIINKHNAKMHDKISHILGWRLYFSVGCLCFRVVSLFLVLGSLF